MSLPNVPGSSLAPIVLQDKDCIITAVNEWEVSADIAGYEKYKWKEGQKFVSVTFAAKGDKIPLKVSLSPEQAKGLEFGNTWRVRIIFSKD